MLPCSLVCEEVMHTTRLCYARARVFSNTMGDLTQACCLAASSAAPANVAVCGPPDGHIGCAAAVAGADRQFRRLYPDQGGLLAALAGGAAANGRPEPDDEDSDSEAVGAMASALRRLAADEP